jgi:uncharacterized protein YycO
MLPVLRSSVLQTGDLVFVVPSLNERNPLDAAILASGAATIMWLRTHGCPVAGNQTAVHVALAWRKDHEHAGAPELQLIEATPPVVRSISAFAFFHSWPNATFFRGTLRNDVARRAGRRAYEVAQTAVGKPYSYTFGPPPNEFYCSSLVDWAYQHATGSRHVFINEEFHLMFVPRAFWVQYYASRNLTLPPPNATGSNPTLLLHSPHITFERLEPEHFG